MRHMMPKELLDAVDLQPQYRTFSEIRVNMLQQARQRADVYEGDVCHSRKKVGTVTPRVSTNTKTLAATKTTTPVPMDVSQMSSNVSKPETEEQRSESYQYEQDQWRRSVCKGKGKGGFNGTCFKCGIQGHKADRCKGDWEKEKGGSKGNGWSKGEWSNPCHTWDSSPYTRHRLEVRGLLLNLFHISVQSVLAHQNVAVWGPRNFAHVNRFSILAPDDNEFTGEGCTPMHTSRSQCQQRKCGAERVDNADAVMNELMNALQPLRQHFPVNEDIRHTEIDRSSGFVSCGVRRRQQRSPSREWIWLEKMERDHGLVIS